MANITIMGAEYQNVNEIYLRDTDTGEELKFVLEVIPTEIIIVSEQTITPTEDYTLLTSTEPLISGMRYSYTINGVERTGTAFDYYGSVILGNPDAYGDGTGAIFGSANGSTYFSTKLRTGFTVEVKKFVDSESTNTIIVPEFEVVASSTYTRIYSLGALTVGETYIYTIDGVESQSVAFENYGAVAIGSPASSIGFEYANNTMYLSIGNSALYGTHTVKVEKP